MPDFVRKKLASLGSPDKDKDKTTVDIEKK